MTSVYRWLMAAGIGLAAMGLAAAGERAPLDPATPPVPMPPPLVSSPPGDGASAPKKESYGVMYIPWHPEGDSVAVAVPSNLGYAPPPGSVPLVGGDFVLPPADGGKLTPKTRIVTFPSEPPETIGAPPPLKLPVGPSGAVGNVVSVERMQEDAASMRKLNQARVKQIKALMDIGKWDEAIGLCEMVLVEDPENGEVRKLLNQAIARNSQANRKNIQSEYDRAIDEAFLSHARDARPRMPVAGTLRPDLFTEVQRLFPRDAEMEATVDAILRQRIKEVNFTNSDLSAILSALHEVSDVNLVYRQEDVAGKPITVRVRNVTLRDLLDLICPQVGLNYTVKNGMVLLFAQGAEDARKYLSQRIVDLKYAPTRSSPPGGGGGGGGAAGGGAAGGGGGGGAQAGEYDVVQLMTWIAENHPGWTPESKWRFEEKFNRVLLIAPPMVLDEVEKLIRSIDMPPIQVHISTHFVSVNENTLRGFGMDWSLQPWPFETSDYQIDPRSTNPITGEEDEDYYNWLQVPSNHMGVGTGTASLGVAGADMTLGVATIINNRRLGAVLSIINNDANSQMITSPATVALNNQSALINLVETYRYPGSWEAATAGISSDYTSSQSITLIPTDWQEKELGTKLEVFPSVGRDMRTIVLRVIPEITALERKETYQMVVDNPSSSGSSSGSTSSVHPVEQPIFSTNTLNAQAVIEDGYTLVVGGLFRDGISITTRRVPGLHRIPLVGKWLFSSENKDHSRKCLLIFVTARILTARNEFYTDNPFEDERHKRETDLIRRRPLNNTVIDDVLGDKPISPWFRRFPQGK